MSDLKQREYYKLFTGSNQDDGNDKIYLGYESNSTEIILKRDNTTYFHIPFFTTAIPLSESSLVKDGAIPGPIPAMSDRIFQKLANYGNSTYWGTPSQGIINGTWLCSWLYSVSGETPIWLDRYYNPGKLTFNEALSLETTYTGYEKNDPIYIDIPSEMILDPGVWYQYFHYGEKEAIKNINDFAGPNKTRLRLDVTDWSQEPADNSIYKNSTFITNFKEDWITIPDSSVINDKSVLNFNNNDFIDTRVVYSSSYNLENEFTLNFWVRNDNWDEATGSQLVGNLNFGGFGVFYDSLKYYPYFVIPENFYGHLFYFNQEGKNFLDKSTQPTTLNDPDIRGTSNPIWVGLNSNSEVLVLDAGTINSVYKKDHTGATIATPKNVAGNPYRIIGTPKQILIDKNDDVFVFTTTRTYRFDKDLTFISLSSVNTIQDGDQFTFNTSGNMFKQTDCLDIKFDNNNNKWVIDRDNILFCNNVPLSGLEGGINATNIGIDPENNIWILHEFNKVTKYSSETLTPIGNFVIGVDDSDLNVTNEKNISFIYTYDRKNNFKTWYALIYHNYEKTLYQVTLNGEIKLGTNLTSKLNIQESPPEQQNKLNLTFTGKGDFTGYEWKRIFNQVNYNNNPQIQFKIAVKKIIRNSPQSTFTVSIPAQYLTNRTWHLVTCTLKNNELKVYINTRLRDTKSIPNIYKVNFLRKNDLYIGTPCGKFRNLNYEINSTSLIFNGYIDNIKIYDYEIPAEFLQIFVRKRFFADDLVWNLPTPNLQYIETIDRFFKHKLPGSKSPFFKLKITGSNITNNNTKKTVERVIRSIIEDVKPAYTDLINIDWFETPSVSKFIEQKPFIQNVITTPQLGLNWSGDSYLPNDGHIWRDIAFGNNRFVIVGTFSTSTNTNVSYHSIDGINWTQSTLPSSAQWVKIFFINGLFIALTGSTSDVGAISNDGINWTSFNKTAFYIPEDAIFADNKYIIKDNEENIFYSTDSTNWLNLDLQPTIGTGTWNSIAYGNNTFVITRQTSTIGSPENFAYSTDFTTWTAGSLPAAADITSTGTTIRGIRFIEGKFIVVVSNGYVLSSEDGINWEVVQKLHSNSFITSLFKKLDNKLFTFNNSLKQYISQDGIDWSTSFVLPPNSTIPTYIAFGNDRYIAGNSVTNTTQQLTSPTILN